MSLFRLPAKLSGICWHWRAFRGILLAYGVPPAPFRSRFPVPTVHDEPRRELSAERRTVVPSSSSSSNAEQQRKRMLIALGVLLLTLVAVVVKDWSFWFPGSEEDEYASPLKKSKPAANITSAAAPTIERKPVKTKTSAAEQIPNATTERAALPPLQVEVVAGNQRKTVPARSNAIHLDLGSDNGQASSASVPASAISASDHVQLSPQTLETVSHPVVPDYPLLARQTKVQGAVILQALISKDGAIQELQIVSGPGILATAAREAVKQWRFKPYYQEGQPVETQARITVNFTISTN